MHSLHQAGTIWVGVVCAGHVLDSVNHISIPVTCAKQVCISKFCVNVLSFMCCFPAEEVVGLHFGEAPGGEGRPQ
jgi:hypothetical protein